MIKTFDFPKYYKVQVNEETGEVKVYSNSKHAKGKELSIFYTKEGYKRVKMNNRSYMIHFLVAHFYLGERPKGLCVNHIDGNKTNNKPSNLEYVTIAENIKHAVSIGLHVANNPEKNGNYKDGRCQNPKKYKHEWYLQNRERIIKRQQKGIKKRRRYKAQAFNV